MDNFVPKYLDRPKLWLVLPIDEFFVLGLPLLIGFLGDFLVRSAVVSVVLVFALRSWKTRNRQWNFRNALYWYLPLNFPSTPPSWVRRYWS